MGVFYVQVEFVFVRLAAFWLTAIVTQMATPREWGWCVFYVPRGPIPGEPRIAERFVARISVESEAEAHARYLVQSGRAESASMEWLLWPPLPIPPCRARRGGA